MVQFEELFFNLDTPNLHEIIANNTVVFPVMETTFNHTEVEWSVPSRESTYRYNREFMPCWGLATEEEELYWKHPLSHLFGFTKFDPEDTELLEHRAYFNRDSSLSFYAQGAAWDGAVNWMVVSTTKKSDEDALAVWCEGRCVLTPLKKLFIYRPEVRALISREFGPSELFVIVPKESLEWLASRVEMIGEQLVSTYIKALEVDSITSDRVLKNPEIHQLAAQFMFSQLVPSPYLRAILYAGLDAVLKRPDTTPLSIPVITEATQLFHGLMEDHRFVAAMHQVANTYLPPFWYTNNPTI